MYGKAEVLELLRSEGMEYDIFEHPAVYTVQEMLDASLPHPESVAKNLFLRDDKKRFYYLLTAREDTEVDLRSLRTIIGSRPLSFASADDLMTMMGLIPGSVTPFGLLNDAEHRVSLFIDSSYMDGVMGIHPNDNTATVWIACSDLVGLLESRGASVSFVDLEDKG